MGRHTSPKAANLLNQAHRRHPGHNSGQRACKEDFHDDALMKRHTRARDRESVATGKPYRTLNYDPSNDLVENWLATTGILYPVVATSSRDVAKPPRAHPRRSSQGHGEDIPLQSPNQEEIAGYTKQHTQIGDAMLPLGASAQRRRRRPISDDSSLLSVAEDRKADPYSSRRDAYASAGTSQRKPRRHLDADGVEEHSPPRSPVSKSPYHERRSRHKTRIDKYDTNKGKRKSSGKCVTRSRNHRKDEKRKDVLSSRNVMEDFDSQAVFQSRITIPQSLSPGLFKNARGGAVKPITDLVFSDMRFLKDRKRDTIPKALSRKRLKELEKQDKEIEEISSFFIPPERIANNRQLELVQDSNSVSELASMDELGACDQGQSISESPVIESRQPIEESYTHHSRDRNINTLGWGKSSDSKASHATSQISQATTYFTWSRTPTRSPPSVQMRANSTSSRQDTHRSFTPGSVREALLQSGIFRNTGIRSYDTSANNANRNNENLCGSMCLSRNSDIGSSNGQKTENPKTASQDTDHMTDALVTSLRARWTALIDSESLECGTDNSPDPQCGHYPVKSAHGLEMRARQTESGPEQVYGTQFIPPDGAQHREPSPLQFRTDEDNNDRPTNSAQDGDMQLLDSKPSGSAGTISVRSRDIMPPPPLPASCSASPLTRRNRDMPTEEEASAAQNITTEATNDARILNDRHPMSHSEINAAATTTFSTDSTFSSLQSASWLPRPYTPSTIVPSRSTSRSRQDEYSLYQRQITTPVEQLISLEHNQHVSVNETMSEYIARIEQDASQRPSEVVDDFPEPNNGMPVSHYWHGVPRAEGYSKYCGGLDECAVDEVHDSRSMDQSQDPSGPEQRYIMERIDDSEYYHTLGLCGASMEEISGNNPSCPFSEGLHQQLETAQTDDIEEERAEMSEFWRPNHFLRF